ncbi:MAG: hypothetical protein HZB17_11025, partial [Chloroflexi bacterium]|nr:hypothetical protein [Chloroflexota bacterium]
MTQTLVDSVVPDVLREGETVFEQLWESISMAQRPVMSALAELTKDEKLTFVPSLIEVRLGSQKQDVRLDELTVSLKNFADMQMLQEVEGRLRFIVPLFAMWVRERKPFQQTIEESKAQEAAQQTEQRNEILVNFALNDRPVGEDKLGYDDYAKAFAQVLANPDTKTPLTIGIYGSWGMGKSFLMEKIKEQLKTAKRAMEEERKKKGLGVKDYHDFHFVHFNAWVYSGSENLWAGLITKLYSEVEKYFGSLRLNWHLLIYNIRKNYKRTIVTLAIYGILGVLIAVLWDYKSVQDSWDALQIATKTLAGGSLVVALGSILKTGYDLFSKLVLARSEQLAAFSSRKD